MNTQRLNERDLAMLDRIVRPAQSVAEMVRAAMEEFFRSELCHRHIERVVHEELKRLGEEDKPCR